MIDWGSELGQRTLQRIAREDVIWLTTVTSQGVPQPRPVWYVWKAGDFLIYSTPRAWKLKHIAANPNVALHFNTDATGEDIQVLLGTVALAPDAPPADRNAAYVAKYAAGIAGLGMSAATYAATFTIALRVTPSRLRGLEPIPEP